MVLPFPRASFADENGFDLTSTESYVEIALSVPGGTEALVPGTSRTVQISVQTHSWENWTNSASGVSETRNEQFTPLSGVALHGSIESGDGSFTLNSASTGSAGGATGTFVSGAGTSRIVVGAAGATATLDFSSPTPESWSYDHSEGLIFASIVPSGSTDHVEFGEERGVEITVNYSSWDGHASSWGNSRTEAFNTSPAVGATVTWTVIEGDGTVTSANAPTDAEGKASALFTMGALGTVVRADVSYGNSHSTNATIGFQPPLPPPLDGFAYQSSAESYSVGSLTISGAADGVAAGLQREITGVLKRNTWEVWADGNGNTETRNSESNPVPGSVSLSVDEGDGNLSSTSVTTDSNGGFGATFTMGSAASRVRVFHADFPGLAQEVVFSPVAETWTYMGDGNSLSVEFDTESLDLVPGRALPISARAVSHTWEVWTSNLGNTENRNAQSAPAPGEHISFAVASGSGTLSAASATTGANGRAVVTFTMAADSSRVAAWQTDTGGLVSDVLDCVLTPEEWRLDHAEATISVSLSSSGATSPVNSGDTRSLSAHVTYANWQIWQSTWGATDRRLEAEGAAAGADVSFAVENGDGIISMSTSTTDTDGNASATFVMGSTASSAILNVTYAAATAAASITFSPDQWIKIGEGGSLVMSLENAADASTITATLDWKTWVEWSNGTTTRRDETNEPAINAPVTFAFASGSSGTLGTPSGYTNGNGKFSTTYSVQQTATIEASASFTGRNASGSVQVSANPGGGGIDSDGDGASDADEAAAGTNPNDANSFPTITTERNGSWTQITVEMEKYTRVWEVRYHTGNGIETTNVPSDVGDGGAAAVAEHLTIDEADIVEIRKISEGWERVLLFESPVAGQKASEFNLPQPPSPIWVFYEWIEQPTDNISTSEQVDNNGRFRTTCTTTVGRWHAEWKWRIQR